MFILEVMAASPSGSEAEKSTDIRSAFRNYLLGAEHTSPGINKRQVWGRMVSQLFAKAALANEWKGRTIWVIQDSLLQNIERTTRLNTKAVSSHPERNISLVVMEYRQNAMGTKEIDYQTTINGDAGIDFAGSHTFTDILLPKFAPPKIELLQAIMRRKLAAILNL